ncbi:energy-coupling factor ABC transporter ATP-binding protein [Robertmurraya korlensis]|uniref:energy-coupling factor ABC transporter ATP-binding protein n=1 Tax=Robertmurraya korlensis TaxID=519977 RepID=UPI0008240A8C|nr:ABC transporter ATP-binding protein [Robertmurraya korlensis]
MSSTIFEFKNVYQVFNEQEAALSDVSFSIKKGKKVALLGNNGAGKSTLLLHLNGILKPTNGSIFFKEEELSYTRSTLKELRKLVGLVLQNPDSQIFSSLVEEDIMFGLRNLGCSRFESKTRTDDIMEKTGITCLKGKPTHFLSQGQKKKVALAGVLVMEPEVLLLDEPTAQLDPISTQSMIQLLNEFHEQGQTTVLSTHDVDFAYEWADEIMIISNGCLLFHGCPYDAFQNQENLRRSQLRKPWLLEVYDEIIKPLNSVFVPKNQDELFSLLRTTMKGENPFIHSKKAVGGRFQ